MKWGSVWDATAMRLLLDRVGYTENALERMRGLLGRNPLGPKEGLWIAPCSSVHTFGMRYGLDLVYLDRKGRVLKLAAGVGPCRLSACWRAHSTLEIPSGTARDLGLTTGMQLMWRASGEGRAT